MKSFFLNGFLAISLLMVFSQAEAQQLGDAAERSSKLTEWMRINLILKDDQLVKVRDINLKYAKKMDALQTNMLPKSEKMRQITDNDKAKDKELKDVLTDAQFQAYLSKKEEIKKKFKEGLKKRQQAG
jgi:hypothetical protein